MDTRQAICHKYTKTMRSIFDVTVVALQILLNDTYKLNHCKEMGAKRGRRFLKQPAEKLKAVFVAFDKERRIPAVGASTEDVDIN